MWNFMRSFYHEGTQVTAPHIFFLKWMGGSTSDLKGYPMLWNTQAPKLEFQGVELWSVTVVMKSACTKAHIVKVAEHDECRGWNRRRACDFEAPSLHSLESICWDCRPDCRLEEEDACHSFVAFVYFNGTMRCSFFHRRNDRTDSWKCARLLNCRPYLIAKFWIHWKRTNTGSLRT